MDNGQVELVQYRLQRAFETFEEARLITGNERWNGCVNRVYYASFYAVKALLAKFGYQRSMHIVTNALFSQYFILTGEISDRSGKIFSQMFTLRQFGNYALHLPEWKDFYHKT